MWEMRFSGPTALTCLMVDADRYNHGLHPSIGMLSNFEVLRLSGAGFGTLPNAISGLTALTSLHVDTRCYGLAVPDGISGLRNLRECQLEAFDDTLTLSESFGQLAGLKNINLAGKVILFPEAFTDLTSLTLHSMARFDTPNADELAQYRLPRLRQLCFCGCSAFLGNMPAYNTLLNVRGKDRQDDLISRLAERGIVL